MSTAEFSALDRTDISMRSFYPRRNWVPVPLGAEARMIPVEDAISLSCRFFPAGLTAPTILFFYGNGETAVDYDEIAPFFNQIGINFFIADYRGYGASGGSPSYTTMLLDARTVLAELRTLLNSGGYSGSIYIMGRSMGRHSAFELGFEMPQMVAGLIIESGRPTLGQFLAGLEDPLAARLEAAYQAKVRSINLPVLVIHGEMDNLAPVQQAVAMYQDFMSPKKRLVTIPGAGHNSLLNLGLKEYFEAIGGFVSSSLPE